MSLASDQLIEKIIQAKQLDGSYIVAGPPGSGKLELAQKFINGLVEPGRQLDHLFTIEPELVFKKIKKTKNSKNDAKAAKEHSVKEKEITVSQVREALSFMSFKTEVGSHKLCLIKQAEKMNTGAQNALLKSLEEPKKGNVFILVTESEEKLLPTICSRSFVIKTGLTAPAEIMRNLIEEGVAQENASAAVYYSWGRLSLAQQLTQSPETIKEIVTIEKDFLELIQAPIFQRLQILEKEKDNGRELITKIDYWIGFLTANLEAELNPELSEIAKNHKIIYNQGKLVALLEQLLALRIKIKHTNASARLALENAFLEV